MSEDLGLAAKVTVHGQTVVAGGALEQAVEPLLYREPALHLGHEWYAEVLKSRSWGTPRRVMRKSAGDVDHRGVMNWQEAMLAQAGHCDMSPIDSDALSSTIAIKGMTYDRVNDRLVMTEQAAVAVPGTPTQSEVVRSLDLTTGILTLLAGGGPTATTGSI